MATEPKRLRASGGYRQLRSFRLTTIVYDATVSFCERFLDKPSRTIDQMVQSARSGRQNIAEGSRASAASSQTELKLTNVARASLDELLLDYEDFLRQRGLEQWPANSPEALAVRRVGRQHPTDQSDRSDEHPTDRSDRSDEHPTDRSDRSDEHPTDQSDRSDASVYSEWLDHPAAEVVANALICLIHQANYLLDRQISGLERRFIEGGGYRERLASERLKHRKHRTDPSDPCDLPPCPRCGGPMVSRMARRGPNRGQAFLGCSRFPDCTGVRDLSDGSVGSVR